VAPILWTIGHSTRPIDELIDLLKAHGIALLADVRTVPRSRHNPQFNTEALAASLQAAGLAYRHVPALGGLRKSRSDSINTGWKNASFRGFADYMQTEQFSRALEELMASGKKEKTAVMCAEAVPWRCHRSLIADALVSRGWTVRHIMTPTKADEHKLTPFAKLENGVLTYPGPPPEPEPTRLF
jgi:uncharacterized protein (DUF488 family)